MGMSWLAASGARPSGPIAPTACRGLEAGATRATPNAASVARARLVGRMRARGEGRGRGGGSRAEGGRPGSVPSAGKLRQPSAVAARRCAAVAACYAWAKALRRIRATISRGSRAGGRHKSPANTRLLRQICQQTRHATMTKREWEVLPPQLQCARKRGGRDRLIAWAALCSRAPLRASCNAL